MRADRGVLDLDRGCTWSWRRSTLERWSAVDGSGADDPDADRRLRVRHPLRAGLCSDLQVNLAYRWFCGLGMEDKVPDHSAFSRARHERFRDSDMFRRVFERVIEACIAAGLVGGKGLRWMRA